MLYPLGDRDLLTLPRGENCASKTCFNDILGFKYVSIIFENLHFYFGVGLQVGSCFKCIYITILVFSKQYFSNSFVFGLVAPVVNELLRINVAS